MLPLRRDAPDHGEPLAGDGLSGAMYESGQWTEFNGRVDLLQDPASLKQRVPFAINADGSLKPWAFLTAAERAAVKEYFRQPESDFQEAYDYQGLVQKIAGLDSGNN